MFAGRPSAPTTRGQLQGQILLRVTDRLNGASLDEPATASDLPLSVTIPCQTTPADPGCGSSCNLASSVDSVLAGAVTEGRRSIWEVRRVVVLDGGSDGVLHCPEHGVRPHGAVRPVSCQLIS